MLPLRTKGFSRRQLFARAGLLGAAAAASPLLQTHYAWAADPAYTGDTLVILSFRGGMDGLSVVVPHGDPAYAPQHGDAFDTRREFLEKLEPLARQIVVELDEARSVAARPR